MDDPETMRACMVEAQIAQRGVTSQRLLAVLRTVPRHRFVPHDLAHKAYDDGPLPIGLGQTISQPYMVACMTELLGLVPGDRVLEIGTGSGYQTAVLSALCKEVVTVERHAALQDRAREVLSQLGYENITYIHGDGSLGWADAAPYDAILVTAGSPQLPPALLAQLGEGGRLVCPVGERARQQLRRVLRQGSGFKTTAFTDCVFVPLTGEAGWPEARN